MYVDNVIPDKGPVYWSNSCFQNNTATITSNADGYSWNLEITTGSPVTMRSISFTSWHHSLVHRT